jgi:hypothetical protein
MDASPRPGSARSRYVRFTPKSGHGRVLAERPLCANSGHRAVIRSVELIVHPEAKDAVVEMAVRVAAPADTAEWEW